MRCLFSAAICSACCTTTSTADGRVIIMSKRKTTIEGTKDFMTLSVIRNCHFTGRANYYILDNGTVQRFYDLPLELVPACGKCGALTIESGEIAGKYFYGRRRHMHVWCTNHVPWWLFAGNKWARWGWKLFRIPAHKWPWM